MIFAALLLFAVAPAAAVSVSSAPAASVSSSSVAVSSAPAVDPEAAFDEAVRRMQDGDAEGGRAKLKAAFDSMADGVDDDELADSLRGDFYDMVERVHDWPDAQAAGESATGLDVSIGTAPVRMQGIVLEPSNPVVQKFIDTYAQRRPQTVEEALARSGLYKDMIMAELKKRGLPPDLFYLVMAESEYKYDAVSHAGAAGLWQLMPGTARKYGLEVSYWVDERFDPVKSTRAAVHYLADLYQWFGDWNLALAAYNRGEGGIGRDLRFSRSTDFGALSGRGAVPNETRFYVPKFMACALIGKDPAKYGLHPRYETPAPIAAVPLARDLDLGIAAKCAQTTVAVLRALNPELRAWCTPKGRPGFLLRLPEAAKAAFLANLAQVKDWDPGPMLVRYRVRRGDYLGRIARRYRTTVRAVMQLNKLRSSRRLRPGMILRLRPGRGWRER